MNKILIALVLAVVMSGGVYAENSNENDFIYVNKENCDGGQNIKNQKLVTEELFGHEVAKKMGCNKKKIGLTSKGYDIPLICKFKKDIKSDDQRCFGLNLYKKFEEGTSIYSPIYYNGAVATNHKPMCKKKIVDSKVVRCSYSFCNSINLNIDEDWFYVIQSLMIDNGWKIESENNQERNIYYPLPKKSNPISTFLNTTIIDYGPDSLPEADINRQKLINTTDPFLFDSKNLNGPKFIRFEKEGVYAEFSWFEEKYREWMHSLYRHDTKTYTFPNAMLFIYDLKKTSRGDFKGPRCAMTSDKVSFYSYLKP